jgi:integrase
MAIWSSLASSQHWRGRVWFSRHTTLLASQSSLRHFYASWLINRKVDVGLELPAKIVQQRMGHSTIVITLDTYGHLFPQTDDGDALALGEKALLG